LRDISEIDFNTQLRQPKSGQSQMKTTELDTKKKEEIQKSDIKKQEIIPTEKLDNPVTYQKKQETMQDVKGVYDASAPSMAQEILVQPPKDVKQQEPPVEVKQQEPMVLVRIPTQKVTIKKKPVLKHKVLNIDINKCMYSEPEIEPISTDIKSLTPLESIIHIHF